MSNGIATSHDDNGPRALRDYGLSGTVQLQGPPCRSIGLAGDHIDHPPAEQVTHGVARQTVYLSVVSDMVAGYDDATQRGCVLDGAPKVRLLCGEDERPSFWWRDLGRRGRDRPMADSEQFVAEREHQCGLSTRAHKGHTLPARRPNEIEEVVRSWRRASGGSRHFTLGGPVGAVPIAAHPRRESSAHGPGRQIPCSQALRRGPRCGGGISVQVPEANRSPTHRWLIQSSRRLPRTPE